MKKSVDRRRPHRPGIALALLVTLTALLLASCGASGRDPGAQDDISETEQREQVSTGPQGSVTLEELTRRPERFYNERVTVNGRVGRTLSPSTFSLTSDEAAESDETFEVEAALVAGGEGTVPELTEGQHVRVTGEVRQFNLERIEQEINANLDDNLYADFEEKPAILPGTVEILADGETTGG